jgi:ribosomal protein S18 acetylase RimI-like enzyme
MTVGSKQPFEKQATTFSKDHASSWFLVEPTTREDFFALCELTALAFREKGRLARDVNRGTRVYQTYQSDHPAKLKHCRIVRDPTCSGVVVGAIQLMCPGDPPDLSMPGLLRHDLLTGEAHVEFVATHPDYSGRGIGAKLLLWAEECSKSQGCSFLSLIVMKQNVGAVRLYKRQGFIVKRDPHDASNCECLDNFCAGLTVYCCLGCQYWAVLYMEKLLAPVGSTLALHREQGANDMAAVKCLGIKRINRLEQHVATHARRETGQRVKCRFPPSCFP